MLKHTIIGAGDYGAGLVANLHLNGHLPQVTLDSFVDIKPNLDELNGRRVWNEPGIDIIAVGNEPSTDSNKIPLYQSISDWLNTRKEDLSNIVVDLALTARHTPQALSDYLNVGVHQFVLPKPFTFDVKKAIKAVSQIDEKRANAAVASNWYYSEITSTVKQLLDRLSRQYVVDHVELDYSCDVSNEEVRSPVHDELPHAIQILASTGLIDPIDSNPEVNLAEPLKVGVKYQSAFNTAPIQVNAFLDTTYNTPSKRKRELRIYLKDDDPEADIVADFDVYFDKNGQLQHPGSIQTITVDLPTEKKISSFSENTMKLMYTTIFKAMKQNFEKFQRDPTVLTLKNYLPIIDQIRLINEAWEKQMKETASA